MRCPISISQFDVLPMDGRTPVSLDLALQLSRKRRTLNLSVVRSAFELARLLSFLAILLSVFDPRIARPSAPRLRKI